MKSTPILALFMAITFLSCSSSKVKSTSQHNAIDQLLNQWHQDVAHYQFEAYFDAMTVDAVFVGTDASEVWSKKEFMNFSRPYFEKKQTWDFKPLQRNIYIQAQYKYAAFDEILDTWMGLCRGSGVVVFTEKGWKIKHYVLSVTVPNEDIKAVSKAKKVNDSLYIQKIVKP